MRDLDQAIARWRRQMTDGGICRAEHLDELEAHLRDDIEARLQDGITAKDAFETSVERLGGVSQLKQEFDKVGDNPLGRERITAALLVLAGIPHANHPNAMNSSINIEPRWATYTKAALFLTPAICLWTFSQILLVPKLQQICREAGVAMPRLFDATTVMANQVVFVVAALLLTIVLLEWRWGRWQQYRRATLGGTVFVLNATILCLITLMVVLALLAAPALMQHAR